MQFAFLNPLEKLELFQLDKLKQTKKSSSVIQIPYKINGKEDYFYPKTIISLANVKDAC